MTVSLQRLEMEKAHAKLRSDLEIHPEADSSVILKDPIVNRFYRFPSVQASVLDLLNGQQEFDVIAEIVSGKHQLEVLPTQVKEFAEKLQALLLLDNPYCWAKIAELSAGKKNWMRDLLSIKLHVFNPDKLLTRLEKKMSFCFSRHFAALTASLAFVALILSAANWDSIILSIGKLFSLYSIPLILIVVSAIMTAHEFAHGLTLKHFGGKVKEMGFLILYFIPAFYCNVSDAWMLKKRERLLVTLAGSYIQVFIWACATVAWRLLSQETVAGQVCLIIIGFSVIQIFFNLIPLIRMDGYYLLSDIVEIPNLRPKALGFLKRNIAAWISGTPLEKKEMISRREKNIFLYYGLSSLLFTAVLLLIMFLRLGGWMIQQYQGFGLFLSSILFLVAVPLAAKENTSFAGTLLKSGLRRIRKAPLFFVVLVLIVAAGFLPWDLKVSGDFSVMALNRISVSSQVVGNLKKIHVKQGDRVRRGDPLAEMENLELAAGFQETTGELAAQRAALDLLKAGTRTEEIDNARTLIDTKKAELYNSTRIEKSREMLSETIAKKTAELENARLNYERTQNLLKDGLVARNEEDRDRTAYQVKQRELQEAKGQLAVLEEQTERDQDIKRKELAQTESALQILLAGSRKESIRAVESQVKKLEEKQIILNRQLELLIIRSPIDGVVAGPHLQNRVGDYLNKDAVFCEIVSEGIVIIEMPVPEKEMDVVRLGLPITMKLRGYPRQRYEALVGNIAPIATGNGLEKTVMVQGELENKDGIFRTGMTGVGKILCGKRRIGELVTRRAIRWLRTEFWEYLP